MHEIVKSNQTIQELLLQQKKLQELENKLNLTEANWKLKLNLMETKCNKWTVYLNCANLKIKQLKDEKKSIKKSLSDSIISLNKSLDEIRLLKEKKFNLI